MPKKMPSTTHNPEPRKTISVYLSGAGCLMLKYAADVTANKYSHSWPDWVIICLWLAPLVPFAIYAIIHEKGLSSRAWIAAKFRDRPISISILILIFVWIAFSQTSRIIDRFGLGKQAPIVTAQQPPAPKPTPPSQPEVAKAPASPSPPPDLPPSTIAKKKSSPPEIQSEPAVIPPPQQTAPPLAADGVSQTMTNSPGGMQAGRDLYAIGKMPSPERIIMPEDIKAAGDILSSGSGSIEIITFPTDLALGSEIDRFATKLESALSQHGWTVYRNRENHIGSFNGRIDMPYGPHGVGCNTSQPPSEASSIATRALSALKYPCAGPSIIGDYGNAGHFTFYITVGTRIVPEQ